MRIDVHAHYFPTNYLDLLDRYGNSASGAHLRKIGMASSDPRDLDNHLRNMDRGHVDLQVLSVSHQMPYFADESHAIEGARFANDLFAEIAQSNPKRFSAFACTPLPHIPASIDEIGRALDKLGMAGITAGMTVMGKSIADPSFDGFFAELDRRKAVLFLHPMGDSAGSRVLDASKLTWPIGAPLEDCVCLLQLMQAEIPARFPNVKIIVPHLGGFAPFLMTRFDQLRVRFLPDSAVMPSVQAKSFWFDSVNGNPWALRDTVEVAGADHVLFGTDYPFWAADAFVLCVEYVKQAGLSAADVDRILNTNAEALLGMGASAATKA